MSRNVYFIRNGRINRNELHTEYEGKECYLNGYPAKIETTAWGSPVIENEKGHKWGYDKNWTHVKLHFPYFMGGGIYRLKDTAEEIKRRMEEEKARPSHPVQEGMLQRMKERLHTLIEKEGQYEGRGFYYPFIEPEETPQTVPSNQNQTASSSNWYRRSQ